MTSHKGLGEFDELRGQDERVLAAIRDFRSSVHAWSEGEFSRPRRVVSLEHRTTWRRAVVWAMSLVMAAGVAGTGM